MLINRTVTSRSKRRASRRWVFLACIGLGLVYPIWKLTHRSTGHEDDAVVRALVADEETKLQLIPRMALLSRDLMERRLPGPAASAAGVLADSATVLDLGPAPDSPATRTLQVEPRSWPVAPSPSSAGPVTLWRSLLDEVASFEHARVFVVEGSHPDADMWRFESTAGFEALARMTSGEWRSFHGRMQLSWARAKTAAGGAGPWQITAWTTRALEWKASPKRLFAEVLDQAMRGAEAAATLRRSLHYEATVQHYKTGMQKLPHPYFAPISANQKEGLAVADVNGDGLDDLYITVRLGKNMLLVNQGDGTFVEQAARYKLDLPGHTTCSLFADFDNDGDLDVILGRSLLRSSYIENRDGTYFQHPIPKFMPMAVISMAAADYNRDGLLDVYLCTYRPAAPMGASPAGGVALTEEGGIEWQDEFLPPELAREYKRREAEMQQRKGGSVLEQVGPPNVLLVNRGGGRFEPAPDNRVVGSWRNSLQATWGDYNQDGWPDLYIANDWALDELYRNDGPDGFKEVSAELGLTAYGFAMGASWGDYDNDGRDDLYVSNMYSEPGRAMTSRIPGVSPMFIESAAGNWLYHHEADGTFRQVAGMEPPAMTVMDAGWSWGGCFADFDNDTFLDLYVLSGYFTAPKGLASEVDLESNLWRTMLRTDQGLARRSFRFSPEWRRTPAPDNLGPEIDARLAGVERQGDQVRVHSLNGSERNRYFSNREGRAFQDVSGLSGLDEVADSRGFAVFDYDRDGWQDVALVNADQPLFSLYRNEMASVGLTGGVIAIRFVGGNRAAAPSAEFACRDGFGARVMVDLGGATIQREHRCGNGWSTQNSATMILGIGTHPGATSLTVRWPSGQTSTVREVAEGTLLTVYENPADAPNGEPFVRGVYRLQGGSR